MVERVADAIMAVVSANEIHDDVFEEAVARAAIAAMREPTEAMKRAAWVSGPEPLWRAMIDEALKQEPKP